MTNEELVQDLKQFIAATVRQETAHLATKDDINRLDQRIDGLEQRLTGRIDRLEYKVDNIQNSIGDAISKINDSNEAFTKETIADHERRFHQLRRRAA